MTPGAGKNLVVIRIRMTVRTGVTGMPSGRDGEIWMHNTALFPGCIGSTVALFTIIGKTCGKVVRILSCLVITLVAWVAFARRSRIHPIYVTRRALLRGMGS